MYSGNTHQHPDDEDGSSQYAGGDDSPCLVYNAVVADMISLVKQYARYGRYHYRNVAPPEHRQHAGRNPSQIIDLAIQYRWHIRIEESAVQHVDNSKKRNEGIRNKEKICLFFDQEKWEEEKQAYVGKRMENILHVRERGKRILVHKNRVVHILKIDIAQQHQQHGECEVVN